MIKGFEHRGQPLVSRRTFLGRVVRYLGFSIVIIGISLGIGILGYHLFEHMSWLDALLNASMILGGMGPVDPVRTDAGKLFASFYALFSGVVFLVAVGVFIAPIFHRFLHAFHVDTEDIDEPKRDKAPGRKR
jgi:hypothetical protein